MAAVLQEFEPQEMRVDTSRKTGWYTRLEEGQCLYCERTFLSALSPASTSRVHLCSDRCRAAHAAKKKGWCPQCNEPLKGSGAYNKVFCCINHRNAWRNETRKREFTETFGAPIYVCRTCSERYTLTGRSEAHQHHCSRACYLKEKKEAALALEKARTLTCALAGCRKTFKRGPHESCRIYCSKECSDTQSLRDKRRARGIPERIEYGPKTCKVCGESFTTTPQNHARARACSSKCKGALRRMRNKRK